MLSSYITIIVCWCVGVSYCSFRTSMKDMKTQTLWYSDHRTIFNGTSMQQA